jgi:hypothetical protein
VPKVAGGPGASRNRLVELPWIIQFPFKITSHNEAAQRTAATGTSEVKGRTSRPFHSHDSRTVAIPAAASSGAHTEPMK